MAACSVCAWLCSWLCSSDAERVRASFWSSSKAWERAHSNDDELWAAESDENRERLDRAEAIDETDPKAAFQLFVEAAEASSPHAMKVVGWYYDTGTVVAADFGRALEYYHRAICAGSWMATISYARILEEHDRVDECIELLEDGVESGFVPANFWLAWFRYKHSKSRQTCRDIRPLLERAADEGHPTPSCCSGD